MGSLQGVLTGTEFLAYSPSNEILCTFVVHSLLVDHAIVVGKDKPPVDVPRWSRAVVSDWKSPPVLVYTSADFPHAANLFPTTSATHSPKFVQAPSLEEAHIVVRSEGDAIIIAPYKSAMVRSQPETRLVEGDPMHLPEAIAGIARFNYFLDCYNQAERLEGLGLEMYRLQGEYPACKPDPSIGQDGNVVRDGEVRLASEKGAKYGFTIRNTSPEDLFPYL